MNDDNQNELLVQTQHLNDMNHNDEIESLKHRLNALVEEKDRIEMDFGCKRARFRELMLKKEEEMRMDREQTNKRIKELEDQVNHLQRELDESKSLLMVSELQKENEIDYYKQKHIEEMGLVRNALNEKLESVKSQYDQEVEQLKRTIHDRNDNDNGILKSATKNHESMLSAVTKSMKLKIGSLNTSALLNSSFDDKQPSSTNKSNKEVPSAQQEEDFDFIVPIEETKMLKEKLRDTDKKLNSYEKILRILMSEFGIEKVCELINACSNPEETFETVNKFKEEFLTKKNLDTSIQLDDKDSILANLLCEQAKLRNENEKLVKRINQLVNSNSANNNLRTKSSTNQLVVPRFNLFSKLRRSQSLTIYNNIHPTDSTSIHQPINRLFNTSNDWKEDGCHRLNRPSSCEMCSNYEIQLQTLQLSESELQKKIENYDKQLNVSKQELIKEQEFRLQMEEKFIQEAKECEKTIEKLQTKLSTAKYEVSQLKCAFNDQRKNLAERLEQLKQTNLKLKHNLDNLQNENERLLGRFIQKSKQLQREAIDLPQTLEDVQFYCLKIREDLISVSIAKEKLEQDFKSQLMLMKEQQKSQFLSEKRIEESLASENEKLKSQLTSALKELHNLKSIHDEHERLLKQLRSSMQTYEKTINELEIYNKDLQNAKIYLEKDNGDLKCKVQNLQSELETSEAVQKDFVKLSQSLQIELEKIRQADSEVRWQHEDDVTVCNKCPKKFNSRKEKIHCNHCGKVFCGECCCKVIIGGPCKNRRFKVCQVCHTLLDQATAPYFSSEVRQNPI